MESQRVSCDVQGGDVPGAFDSPLLTLRLAKIGRYDAIVCAALVVDGSTYRRNVVSQVMLRGLMQAQPQTEAPMNFISLTPHNFQPMV